MLDDKTQNLSSNIMLGKGWIAYDSRAWSNGLPTIGDKRLIPGPQHDKIKDDF